MYWFICLCFIIRNVDLLWRYALPSKGASVHLHRMLPVQNPGMCTCISPHQSVPMSAAQRPSPGLHTSHRMKTYDRGAQENRGHLTTEVGRHSPSGSFTTLSPPVQSARLTESVCGFQLWSNRHFRQWEKRDNWWLYNTSLVCGPFGDAAICGEFGRIMEINLAELVVVKPPQLLRLIIMTNRNIFLKRWRAFLLVLITFHIQYAEINLLPINKWISNHQVTAPFLSKYAEIKMHRWRSDIIPSLTSLRSFF